MAFRGSFPYQLDDRNRVGIPPRYRGEFENGAVLTQGVERCVQIFTPDGYDEQAAVVNAVPPESEQGRKLRRAFFGKAFDVQKDGQGRLLIPAKLLEYAGIEKDVVVVGRNECLEIWDEAAWNAQDEDLAATTVAVFEDIGARKSARMEQGG